MSDALPRGTYWPPGSGLEIIEQVPVKIRPNPHNKHYLKTTREKLGHLLRPASGAAALIELTNRAVKVASNRSLRLAYSFRHSRAR